MNELVPKDICCGCEACLNICPQNAISIIYDEFGFRYPKIDVNKCIDCQLCKMVCPVLQKNETRNINQHIFAGSRIDSRKLANSASGGAAATISETFVKNGGYVAGVRYSADYCSAEYSIENEIKELNAFYSSKYIQSEKNNVYREINRLLKENKRVLFIGLPCDVNAAKLYTKNNQLLYTIALVCHGPTSPQVGKQYVEYMERRFESSIISFNVRSKPFGWEKPYLSIEFTNGKIFQKPFYSTEYGLAFSMLQRPCCYDCKFKAKNIKADIILGDCWGLSKEHKAYNHQGTSLIITRTQKGVELLNIIKDFLYFEVEIHDIAPPAMNTSLKKDFQREDYERLFIKKGSIGAYKVMSSIGYKIRYHIKKQ